MNPARPLNIFLDGRRLVTGASSALALMAFAGCEQNTFVPPPPPKVDVAMPVQRPVTHYLEVTGNTAPIKSVDLVARVQGFLQSIDYEDGAFVKEGTTLFTIEPETYRLKVDQAQAALVFAEQQAARYEHLEQTGYGTTQNAQQYSSQLRQQQAALASTQATLKLAQRQLESLKAQRNSALANLAQAQAQRDQAKLNLAYTAVTAAQPGRVVNLSAAAGQFAQPGTNLTMFVPDQIWVTANFKENQLDRMRPGEAVTLQIDAYPGRTIRGHIDSVQPGSGTAFSLLPAQNATGNYVKIVQRVPVKIVMDNPPTDVALGPGMSVVPTVRINPAPSLYERLRKFI